MEGDDPIGTHRLGAALVRSLGAELAAHAHAIGHHRDHGSVVGVDPVRSQFVDQQLRVVLARVVTGFSQHIVGQAHLPALACRAVARHRHRHLGQ